MRFEISARNTENSSKLESLFTWQNAQDIQKCVILDLFHSQNIINTQNYFLNAMYKKWKKKHFQVSCAFCKVNSVSSFSGFPVLIISKYFSYFYCIFSTAINIIYQSRPLINTQ